MLSQLLVTKMMLIKVRYTAIQSADDESSLLVRIPNALACKLIDMSIGLIFSKRGLV